MKDKILFITMHDYEKIVKSIIAETYEREWFELKENWFEAHQIGEYISALSNAAALNNKPYSYLIWGIDDKTHKITGTTFDYQQNFKHEPFQHYLARNLTPDIAITFHEITLEGKRIVILEIPAAEKIPTSFESQRYLRIGSSKVTAAKYPQREAQLYAILNNGYPTIETLEAQNQELTFSKLFTYYAGRGITLRKDTFAKNLGLLTKERKYNYLAQLLSDNSEVPIRVSIFRGENKASLLHSVKEFGNTCLLVSLEKILEYGDILNIVLTDERNRILSRREIELFDKNVFREALVNAFVHNKWVDGNAPMITVFKNRLEILSRGTISPNQTMEGFFNGESVPVNQKLSDIFLQLRISERCGRGVPKITDVYGRGAFEFRENSIVVTLPFDGVDGGENGISLVSKLNAENSLSVTEQRVLEEFRNNPNITQKQLMDILGKSQTTIYNAVASLKKRGFLIREGSNKRGYWIVKIE